MPGKFERTKPKYITPSLAVLNMGEPTTDERDRAMDERMEAFVDSVDDGSLRLDYERQTASMSFAMWRALLATLRPERVAQLIAHRAVHAAEHDPANGKLHGFCLVCGVPWPCDVAAPVRAQPTPEIMEHYADWFAARNAASNFAHDLRLIARGMRDEMHARALAVPNAEGER